MNRPQRGRLQPIGNHAIGTYLVSEEAHNGAAFGVAISPDDRWLVSAGWDSQIKMWDLKTGDVVWTWKRK